MTSQCSSMNPLVNPHEGPPYLLYPEGFLETCKQDDGRRDLSVDYPCIAATAYSGGHPMTNANKNYTCSLLPWLGAGSASQQLRDTCCDLAYKVGYMKGTVYHGNVVAPGPPSCQKVFCNPSKTDVDGDGGNGCYSTSQECELH